MLSMTATSTVGITITSTTTIASSSTPQTEVIEECDAKERKCIEGLIEKYSEEFNYSEKMAKDIASCESDLRPNVYGDGGKAYGVYQFHKPTFIMFSKQKGEKLDYYDTEDNIKLAIWALANNKENHWSCYKKVATK